ncbi:hypothetical protein PMAYCL1PPCAC_20109, partial [Pristionchus mayeri]
MPYLISILILLVNMFSSHNCSVYYNTIQSIFSITIDESRRTNFVHPLALFTDADSRRGSGGDGRGSSGARTEVGGGLGGGGGLSIEGGVGGFSKGGTFGGGSSGGFSTGGGFGSGGFSTGGAYGGGFGGSYGTGLYGGICDPRYYSDCYSRCAFGRCRIGYGGDRPSRPSFTPTVNSSVVYNSMFTNEAFSSVFLVSPGENPLLENKLHNTRSKLEVITIPPTVANISRPVSIGKGSIIFFWSTSSLPNSNYTSEC